MRKTNLIEEKMAVDHEKKEDNFIREQPINPTDVQ